MAVKCPSCGKDVGDGASFCAMCGREIAPPRLRPRVVQSKAKRDGKTMWIVDLVVVFVILLPTAVALYYMTRGYGPDEHHNTPYIQILNISNVTGGYRVTLTSPSSAAKWIDVQVQLTSVNGTSAWNLKTITWTGTSPARANMSSSLGVHLLVQDLEGDGQIRSGDSLTFTVVPAGAATLALAYTPTGSMMMSPASLTG